MWINEANNLRKAGIVVPLGLLVRQAEASFSVESFHICEKYGKAVEANQRHIKVWRDIGKETKSNIEAITGSLMIQQADLLYLLGNLNEAKRIYEEAMTTLDRLGKLNSRASVKPRGVLLARISRCANPRKHPDYRMVSKNLEEAEYYRAIAGFYNSAYCYEKALKLFNLTLQSLQNIEKGKRYVTASKTTFEQLYSEILPGEIRHCRSALDVSGN